MKKTKMMLTVISSLALTACAGMYGQKRGENWTPEFQSERIKADVEFLAQDLLRGRDTGSEGHRIAANYVATEFAQLGLKPGNGDSYMQEVSFVRTGVIKESAKMQLRLGDETLALKAGEDFVVSGSQTDKTTEYGGELVFVGYAIDAPEMGHNDFEGLDLEGKIAVRLTGAPKAITDSEFAAYYGSGTTKMKEIAKRGAVGSITIFTKASSKRYSFERYAKSYGRKSLDWVAPEGATKGSYANYKGGAVISADVATKLWAANGKDFDAMLTAADEGFVQGFAMKGHADFAKESDHSNPFDSPNVLAVLEGSDDALKEEYVVLTAHLDHIGVSKTAKGDDKINNGALDNASGVAVMLEVARKFREENIRPKRSIIFAAVTAEEKGLLGAEYFINYPTVEKSKIVANVNLDMPVLLYDFTDLIAFGSTHSTLGPITARAIEKMGMSLSEDPMPEQAIFTRSDHYPFVLEGVPAVMLATGFGDTADGEKGGKYFMDFLTKTYHRPHDDTTQDIDYQAATKFARVNWLILNEIANGKEAPKWNEGDFFGGKTAAQ